MGAWQAIGADAVGFTMVEVLRTSLGFAGARDAGRRISDPDALRAYQARPPLVRCATLVPVVPGCSATVSTGSGLPEGIVVTH